VGRVLATVRRAVRLSRDPSVTEISRRRDPFRVLAATILSLRTKDATTAAASERLFKEADSPEGILRLSAGRIEQLIFPVGFYRTKARRLRAISRTLLEEFGGKVPRDLETLLKLEGVGRKTANLVLTLGHDLPGVCVDVHVHRITNRWGYVRTRSPHDTEMALRRLLPRRYWKEINDLLVTFGQTVCRPVSPWCSRCQIARYCARVAVRRSR
jgi:endonuclease-3